MNKLILKLSQESMKSGETLENFLTDFKKNPTKYYCFSYEELVNYTNLLVRDVIDVVEKSHNIEINNDVLKRYRLEG